MADLRIPDWKPIDFSGTAEIPQIYLAAKKASMDSETQRQYAENAKAKLEFEKESAQRAREQAQHERDVERTKAFPALFRAARNSIGEANLMGQPYGVSFEEAPGGPRVPSDLFKAAGNAYGNFAADTLAKPAQEAPVYDQTVGQHSGAPPQAAPGDEAETAHGPVEEATEALAAAKPKIRARYNGQVFDLPEETAGTGLGPKYQAVFDHAVAQGLPEEKAFGLALTMQEKDEAQDAIAKRTAAAVTGREVLKNKFGLTAEQQIEEKRLQREQSEKNARIGAAGRVAAAMPAIKADTANRQDINSLRAEVKDWRAENQLSIDSKMAKRLTTAAQNLNSGNAMQQREGAESLVSVFKGGGQVTKASQDLLLKHIAGLVGDAQTFVQHLVNGQYGDRELSILNQAAQNALQEQKDKAQSYYQSAQDRFGPGSGWEALAPNVNHDVKSHFRQFGLDVPDIYPNAGGGVRVGSGKRPPPGGTSGGGMITIRNKKTGESKTVTREEAKRMGAIP